MKKLIIILLAFSLLSISCQSTGDVSEGGMTVEHSAESINALITEGGNLEVRDSEGWTALMKAAESGHIPTINALIFAGANLEAQMKDGMTALKFATFIEQTEIAKLLKDAGATE